MRMTTLWADGGRVILRHFTVALLGLGLGCSTSSKGFQPTDATKPNQQTAVSVGDWQVSASQVSRLIAWRMGEMADSSNTNEVKSRLLEDLVEEQLLDIAATKAGVVAQEPEIQAYLQQMESDKSRAVSDEETRKILRLQVASSLRAQKYVEEHLVRPFKPDQEVLGKFYQEHLQDFMTPETVRVKEILVNNEVEAERILNLLKSSQGKNFNELARLYSKAPSAENGGEMGVFARGDLPEELEKVFFEKLKPGRIGQVFQTMYGYHIFLLVERSKPYQKSLETAGPEIAEKLREEYQRTAVQAKLEELRNDIPIKIYRNRLDFRYNGDKFSGGFF
jgi:peptidyl-prolyl cis-trans isomerase C